MEPSAAVQPEPKVAKTQQAQLQGRRTPREMTTGSNWLLKSRGRQQLECQKEQPLQPKWVTQEQCS